MPRTTDVPHGAPAWIDLHTTDRDGAAAFYAALFGWDVSTPEDGAVPYVVASGGNGPVASIGPMSPDLVERGARGAWTLYFAVDDVDAAVAAVPEAGGRVVLSPGVLGRAVRVALVCDPAGAVFGLWQGRHEAGWVHDETRAADWFELVGDGAMKALDFYIDALGMTVSRMPMGDDDYPMLGAAGVEYAGVDDSAPGAVAWRVYFGVDDIDAARERIAELGGAMLTDTARFDGIGAWAAARDPQGAVFSILQPPAPSDTDGAPQEGTTEDD